MPVYTPPALNAVDFALTARAPQNVDPYLMALTSYTVPALNSVDFALVSYTQPVYNTIDFELLGGVNFTLNLADSVILSEAISKVFGKNVSDSVTLSDSLSGGIPGGQTILAYRWYFVKIFVARLEGRIVFRIRIFD